MSLAEIKKLFKNIYFALLASSFISIALVIIRVTYSYNYFYLFMIWNLFLAWLPFVFATLLKEYNGTSKYSIYVKGLLLLLWLLFFPNSLYIVTDLFHLFGREAVPMWYDLVLLMSFVWNGLILGFLSLYIVHNILKRRIGIIKSNILVFIFILLSSFGIYLGRYERWNSWDIFISPFELFKDIFISLTHPFSNPRVYGVTLFFTLLFMVCYWIFIIILEADKKQYKPRE